MSLFSAGLILGVVVGLGVGWLYCRSAEARAYRKGWLDAGRAMGYVDCDDRKSHRA